MKVTGINCNHFSALLPTAGVFHARGIPHDETPPRQTLRYIPSYIAGACRLPTGEGARTHSAWRQQRTGVQPDERGGVRGASLTTTGFRLRWRASTAGAGRAIGASTRITRRAPGHGTHGRG